MRLIILFSFFVSFLYAQKTTYTITKKDNTEFLAKSYSSKTKYLQFTTINNKKIQIPYIELDNIEVDYEKKVKRKIEKGKKILKFIRISNRNGVLMKVLKEGKCNLYAHEFQYTHYYVLRKEEQIATPIYLKQILSNNFKKTAMQYFKDCDKVLKKIESKDFTKKNISEMIDFYNSNCE